MIRVLHLLATMGYGGVETWLMHVLRHMDRTKFQFDFCYTKPSPGAYAPEIESLGASMVACPLDRRKPLAFARCFRSLLRREQYDIVHSHVHHFSGFALRLARREAVAVRIAHSHNTSDGKSSSPIRNLYRAWMKHWIGQYATHGVAVSGPAAVELFGAAWESDARFCVLPLGIDLEPFRQTVSSEAVRRELGIPARAPVVGHVGRFDTQKNHALLLDIAKGVISRRPDVRFLLVGDGPLRSQIEARARELGLGESVMFTGVRSDVPRLMRGALNLFLFPSLWEGLGLVVVEAQAAGLRCVVSDEVPSDATVVAGLVTSLSLQSGVEPWVEAVLRDLDRPAPPPAPSWQAIADSEFNVRRSCDRLLDLYRRSRQ